jgi:hypothetical protein
MTDLAARWLARLPELEGLAQPLLRSPAVQRLRKVTFLGILSPRFREFPGWPLSRPATSPVADDGSRFDHSIGVAATAVELARRLGMSASGQRYAAAWGLTHDIATWPLAHTGEPAFAATTGITSRRLRAAMVLGQDDAPAQYRVVTALREMAVDAGTLAELFDGLTDRADEELALLSQVIHSPLTPDTLEGSWRCGAVFGVPVPSPEEVLPALIRQGRVVHLHRHHLHVVLDFWNRKAEVYRRCINRQDVVLWESAWSLALQRDFAGLSLADSLEISEDELVQTVRRKGLPSPTAPLRYKEPQDYYVNGDLDALPPEPRVSDLWRVLRREPVGSLDR